MISQCKNRTKTKIIDSFRHNLPPPYPFLSLSLPATNSPNGAWIIPSLAVQTTNIHSFTGTKKREKRIDIAALRSESPLRERKRFRNDNFRALAFHELMLIADPMTMTHETLKTIILQVCSFHLSQHFWRIERLY